MNYWESLKNLEASEVREFVKENEDKEEFLSQVLDQPDSFFPLLLKSKAFPTYWMNHLSSEVIPKFLEYTILSSYNIGSVNLEKLLLKVPQQEDSLLLAQIQAFPTLPITSLFLMRAINNALVLSATEIITSKAEFQKPEFISLLLKLEVDDARIFDIALKHQSVVNQVIKSINEGSAELYSIKFINALIESELDTSDLDMDEVILLALSTKSYTEILTNNRSRKNEENNEIPWNEQLEEVDESLLFKIIVNEAPVSSKFRLKWISVRPEKASDKELLSAYKLGSSSDSDVDVSESLVEEIMGRDISLLKKISPLEHLSECIGAKALTNSLHGNVDKALYLFTEGPSKFRTALRFIIPLELIPDGSNKRKKSYFNEAITAISESNADNFLWAVTQSPYNIEKFAEDTNQSSKKENCSQISISSVILVQLSKDQILSLCDSSLSFAGRYEEENNYIKHSLKLEESFVLLKKVNVEICFDLCLDKPKFISSKNLSDEELSSLYRKRSTEIMGDDQLLSAYIKRVKNQSSMNLGDDEVKAFSKIMTAEDLRSFIRLDSQEEKGTLCSLINVKCKDGQFFVTNDQIMELASDSATSESNDFWEGILDRDSDLAKKIGESYLGGSKAMSDFLGKKVTIRRNKKAIDKVEGILQEINHSSQAIVEEIFSNGGKLSDFKERLFDWEKSLSRYGQGRIINVPLIEYSDISELNNKSFKFNVEKLVLNFHHYIDENIDENLSNITVKTLIITESTASDEKELVAAKEIQKILNLPINLDSNFSFDAKLSLLMSKTKFEGDKAFLNEIIEKGGDFNSFNLEKLNFLLDNGMVLKKEYAQELIDENVDDIELMKRISQIMGGLSKFTVEKEIYRWKWIDKEDQETLLDLGLKVNVLKEDDDEDSGEIENPWEEKIRKQGEDFSIDVSEYSIKEKLLIVRFIEQEIDPNYLKLELASSNLDNIENLTSYESMRKYRSLDMQDLIKAFNIPSSIVSNKKIMKGIKDLVALNDGQLVYKVERLKEAVGSLNSSIELTVADFINYDNQSEIIASEVLNKITPEVHEAMVKTSKDWHKQSLLMKNKNKGDILRFLRLMSESGRDDRYVISTLRMTEETLEGVAKLNTQIAELITTEENEDRVKELQGTVVAMANRIETLSLMNDLDLIHDNLVVLLKYLESDPLEELKQTHFKSLENNKDIHSSLGYHLYFPQTRGDLVFMGENNGWCVSYSKSYGSGVIEKGNILIGLCEEGKDSDKENVVALAHFERDKNGHYSLEQLRWSNRVKDRDNVDASDDFDYSKILSLLTFHLHELSKEKKNDK